MFGLRKPLALGAEIVLFGVAAWPIAAAAGPAPGVDAAATVVAASAGDAQVVARDADGTLRAATPEEAQALQRSGASLRKAAPTMQARAHWSGARGARLTDEFLSHSVMVKMPDGRLVELCVVDAQTAAAVSRSPSPAKSFGLPTE